MSHSSDGRDLRVAWAVCVTGKGESALFVNLMWGTPLSQARVQMKPQNPPPLVERDVRDVPSGLVVAIDGLLGLPLW